MSRESLIAALRSLSRPEDAGLSDDQLLYKTASEYDRLGRLDEFPELKVELARQDGSFEATRRGFAGDVAAAAKRGFAQGMQGFNVMQGADDPTNARDIADWEAVKARNPNSTEMQDFMAAKGFIASAKAFASNPVTIVAEIITESLGQGLPSIAGTVGGAALGGAKGLGFGPAGAAVGAAAGAAVGSGVVEYSAKILDAMQEAGMDPADPISVQEFFSDPAKVDAARKSAVMRAIPVALFDGATAGLAGRFVAPLKAIAEKGGTVAVRNILASTAGEIGLQAAGGATGELAGQVASGEEIDPKSIFLEGIAEVGTAPVEVRSNLGELRRPARTPSTTFEETPETVARKASFEQVEVPDVEEFFKDIRPTAPSVGAQVTLPGIVEKIVAGNSVWSVEELQFAQTNAQAIQEALLQRKQDLDNKRAKTAAAPGSQMTFGDETIQEALRTTGDPVIRPTDTAPDVPYQSAAQKGETLWEQAARVARERAAAVRGVEPGEQLPFREPSIRDAARTRGEPVIGPLASEDEVTLPRRMRDVPGQTRLDFTESTPLPVPVARPVLPAGQLGLPLTGEVVGPGNRPSPQPTAPVETPAAGQVIESQEEFRFDQPGVVPTPARITKVLPTTQSIDQVPERKDNRVGYVLTNENGSKFVVPVVYQDGKPFAVLDRKGAFASNRQIAQQIAKEEGANVGKTKAGRDPIATVEKILNRDQPFTADGKVDMQQIAKLVDNPEKQQRYARVAQRAIDLGWFKSDRFVPLGQFLTDNKLTNHRMVVMADPIAPGIHSFAVDDATLEKAMIGTEHDARWDAKDPKAVAERSVIEKALFDSGIPSAAMKRFRAAIENLIGLAPKERDALLADIRGNDEAKAEQLQAQIDAIIGQVRTGEKGDTPGFKVKLALAALETAPKVEVIRKAKSVEADRAEYDRIQAEMAKIGHDKIDTPEYQALWKQSEAIKNRHGGFVPVVPKKEAPPQPAKKTVARKVAGKKQEPAAPKQTGADAALEELDEWSIQDTTKAKIMGLAKKYLANGLITERDFKSLQVTSKDKDMGVDDVASELRSSLLNRAAPPIVKPVEAESGKSLVDRIREQPLSIETKERLLKLFESKDAVRLSPDDFLAKAMPGFDPKPVSKAEKAQITALLYEIVTDYKAKLSTQVSEEVFGGESAGTATEGSQGPAADEGNAPDFAAKRPKGKRWFEYKTEPYDPSSMLRQVPAHSTADLEAMLKRAKDDLAHGEARWATVSSFEKAAVAKVNGLLARIVDLLRDAVDASTLTPVRTHVVVDRLEQVQELKVKIRDFSVGPARRDVRHLESADDYRAPNEKDLLDKIVYAMQQRGLKVAMAEATSELSQGGIWNPTKRTVVLVLDSISNPSRSSVLTAMHEIMHDIVNDAPKDIQRAFHDVVERMPNGDFAFWDNPEADPRLMDGTGLTPEQLTIERMVEHLAILNVNRDYARGILATFIRALKDMLIRGAVYLQKLIVGENATTGKLAQAWFDNEAAKVLSGDARVWNDFLRFFRMQPSSAEVFRLAHDEHGAPTAVKIDMRTGQMTYTPVADLDASASNVDVALAFVRQTALNDGTWQSESELKFLQGILSAKDGEMNRVAPVQHATLMVRDAKAHAEAAVAVANSLHPIVERMFEKYQKVEPKLSDAERAALKRAGIPAPRAILNVSEFYQVLGMKDPRVRATDTLNHFKAVLEAQLGQKVKIEDVIDASLTVDKLPPGAVADRADDMMAGTLSRLRNRTHRRLEFLNQSIAKLAEVEERNRTTISAVMEKIADLTVTRKLLSESIADQFKQIEREFRFIQQDEFLMGSAAATLSSLEDEAKRSQMRTKYTDKVFRSISIDELPLHSLFVALDKAAAAKGLQLDKASAKEIRAAVMADVRSNPDSTLGTLVELGEGPMAKARGTAILGAMINFARNEAFVAEVIRVQMMKGEERANAINELRRIHKDTSEKVLDQMADLIEMASKPSANFDKLGQSTVVPTINAAHKLIAARDSSLRDQAVLARMRRDAAILSAAKTSFDQLATIAEQRLQVGSAFIMRDGSSYLDAGSVDAKDGDILNAARRNKLVLSGPKAMTQDQMRELIQRNQDWIDSRKSDPLKQGRVYHSMVRQNHEMRRMMHGPQVREAIAGWRNGEFFGLADALLRTGTKAGERLAASVTQFVGWQRLASAKAEVEGKVYEVLRKDFEKAAGLSPKEFLDLFYEPARFFMDNYLGSEADAFAELNRKFSSDTETARFWKQPGASTAFFRLLQNVKKQNALESMWAEQAGANRVEDPGLVDNDIFAGDRRSQERRRIETGVPGYTSYRNLRDDIRRWASAFSQKIAGDAEGNPFANLSLRMKVDTMSAQVRERLNQLFDEDAWHQFLLPLFHNEQGGVPRPKGPDGINVVLLPQDIRAIVDASPRDVFAVADAIFKRFSADQSDAARAEYRENILSWLQTKWKLLADATEVNHRNAAIITTIPSLGINARTAVFMPQEWLTYPQYTPEDHRRAAHAIFATGAFGRGAQVVTSAVADIAAELDAKRRELDARGLSAQSVDDERWLALKSRDKATYERLKRLAAYREPDFRRIFADIFQTEHSLWTELHTVREIVAGMTVGMVTGLKSAIKNPVSTLNLINVQRSATPEVLKTVGGAYAKQGKLFLNSVAQVFGVDLLRGNPLLQAMVREGAFDAANKTTVKQLMTGERGVHDSLSRFARAMRLLRTTFSHAKLSPVEGGTSPALRVFNPFQYTQQLVNMGNTWQLMQTYYEMAERAADVYRANPKETRSLTAKDVGLTSETVFRARKEMIESNGYSLEELAQKIARRQNPFDSKLVMAMNNISTTLLANEASVINRPLALSRTKTGQVAGIFLGWSLDQTTKTLKMLETPEGRMTVSSLARGVGILGMATLPLSLAYAAMLDEWDEWIERKQNRRPVLSGPEAWSEAAVSVGSFGLVAEGIDMVLSPRQGTSGFNDALSLDNRIVVISSARGVVQAVRNLARVTSSEGVEINYANVMRPFLASVGVNGILQNAYVLDRVLGNTLQELPVVGGVIEAEASVALRSNLYNYLRVAGRDVGLEVRNQGGGGYTITRLTPHITNMSIAALRNDREGFQEAYRRAVKLAAEDGHPDPLKKVQENFAARHPLRILFVGTPSMMELGRMLEAMPPAGREAVNQGLANFEAYSAALGSRPFAARSDLTDAQWRRVLTNADDEFDSPINRARNRAMSIITDGF
jgi:hypothetical protein